LDSEDGLIGKITLQYLHRCLRYVLSLHEHPTR